MSKTPLFSESWYETPRIFELRQEIHNLYDKLPYIVIIDTDGSLREAPEGWDVTTELWYDSSDVHQGYTYRVTHSIGDSRYSVVASGERVINPHLEDTFFWGRIQRIENDSFEVWYPSIERVFAFHIFVFKY